MAIDLSSLLIQGATLLSALATAGGVVIGVRIYRRQMNAQLFLAFTARYESIMSELPEDAPIGRADGSIALPPHWPGVYAVVLRYLNLCSEEYYLCEAGHLDKSLWRIWEGELKRTVRSLVRPEWPELRREFESYPEFRDFVDGILRDSPGAQDGSPGARDGSRAFVPPSPAAVDPWRKGAELERNLD